MKEEIFKIPNEGFTEVKEFCNANVNYALADCQNNGMRALFIPEIVDARIALPTSSKIWQLWYCAPSVSVIGRTKFDRKVVVYAHVQNYFCNPEHVKDSKSRVHDEFLKLLDMEDNKKVFVVDYDAFRTTDANGLIDTSKALKHLPTIAFLGGKERTEAYIAKHEDAIGKKIGFWHYRDSDDIHHGRFLMLGTGCSLTPPSGDTFLGNVFWSFLGVRDKPEDARIISSPSLEQIMKVSSKYIAPADIKEAEKEIGALYK